MPVSRSVKKALRNDQRKYARNKKQKEDLKKALKEYTKIAKDDAKTALTKLPAVFKKLDKAAKRNIIAQNKANRLKSRLSKLEVK